MNTQDLRKAASAVFLATEEDIARDLSQKLNSAANEIDRLRNGIQSLQGRIVPGVGDKSIWIGKEFSRADLIAQLNQLLQPEGNVIPDSP